MNRSESIAELTKAVIEFHKKIGKIGKDSTNPFFKSNYASLPNILDAIQEPLNECDLTVMQFPEGENGLTSILAHTSGEYIEETYYMTPQKNDPQGQGSAITYQRRYALGAVLSLNIDEDDDGNGASNNKNGTPKRNQQEDNKPWLNEGTPEWEKVVAKLRAGKVDTDTIYEHFKVNRDNRAQLEGIEKEVKHGVPA